MKFTLFLLFSLLLLLLLRLCGGDSQGERLSWLIDRQIAAPSYQHTMEGAYVPPVHIALRRGSRGDKIEALPGQPNGVDFNQYSGYVTVNPATEKALFYYLAESPGDSSKNPLILWLSGGPGCSSLGLGAMQEVGPFRVNPDGKTLDRNPYSWNQVANVLFLDSAAGVGYSYSNSSFDYQDMTNRKTTEDSYNFLINWLERFPEYKSRDFYIMGDSYAGHYVPRLAEAILTTNNHTHFTPINLRGIAIGNPWIDLNTGLQGRFEYLWSHALLSDQRHEEISKLCGFDGRYTKACQRCIDQASRDVHVKLDNIYAPVCGSASMPTSTSAIPFDPCTENYVLSYLNMEEVQRAFHVQNTKWAPCSEQVQDSMWRNSPPSMLTMIKQLMASGLRMWLYSGDVDGIVPITATKYAVGKLNLPLQVPWRAWTYNNLEEVGGYVIKYQGLTLATIRGAGHGAVAYQPERALTLITSFLHGKLPPPISDMG